MKKVRIGILGGGLRGLSLSEMCKAFGNGEIVAICENSEWALENCRREISERNMEKDIALYTDFNEFLNCDMDAVILENYATEHAPYAIKCLERGLHVMSDTSPVQCLKEAVELVEAVEKSGKIYSYGENCCYYPGVNYMRENYAAGKYGKVLYAEGEYNHDCETLWPIITYGDRNHWRNRMYATYYCTHSLGPLIYMTNEKPDTVVGFELPPSPRLLDLGALQGTAGIIMLTTKSGAVFRSLNGNLHKGSHWFSVFGTEGAAETDRNEKEFRVVYEYNREKLINTAEPKLNIPEAGEWLTKHGGIDYIELYYFIRKIAGHDDGRCIDVYTALDMWLPGLLAYRSICNGNVPVKVPDMRNKEEREQYRNDTWCVDPKVAGKNAAPSYSKGNPEIPDSVYEKVAKMCEDYYKDKK